MHLDETNHVGYNWAESSLLMNGLRLLPRPLQTALLLSLASCVSQPWQMPPQWNYRRITAEQAEAAAIKAPLYNGGPRYSLDHGPQPYPLHAGNPPKQHSEPQPYPGVNKANNHHAASWAHSAPSRHSAVKQNVVSADELQYLYGWLYGRPEEARKALPRYAFFNPKGFQQYTVQAGDTFSQICQRAHLDRRVVWRYNWMHIHNAHVLMPGQVIKLPVF